MTHGIRHQQTSPNGYETLRKKSGCCRNSKISLDTPSLPTAKSSLQTTTRQITAATSPPSLKVLCNTPLGANLQKLGVSNCAAFLSNFVCIISSQEQPRQTMSRFLPSKQTNSKRSLKAASLTRKHWRHERKYNTTPKRHLLMPAVAAPAGAKVSVAILRRESGLRRNPATHIA